MKLRLFLGDGEAAAEATTPFADEDEPALLMVLVEESEKYLNEMRGDDLRRKEFLGGNVFDADMFMFCGRVADFSLIGVFWNDRSFRLADSVRDFLGVDVFETTSVMSPPSLGVSSK